MDMDFFINYLLPPLVGAVIGYFTNLIAVKMLFFPHEEKRIFGWHVPFTPGAIPKGKARLAKSAGMIVQNELFTGEDISVRLLSDEVEKPIIDKVMSILDEEIRDTGAILTGSAEKYDMLEESFIQLLNMKILEAFKKMDLPELVKDEGGQMIRQHISESRILRTLVSDNLVDIAMINVGRKMEEFIELRGPEMIGEITAEKIHDLGKRTPLYVLDLAGYDPEFVRNKIQAAYRESVVNAVNSALKRINVSQVVEDKINSMSVEELEKGVLTVMKTELNMIVSLGALIGLVIGCINIIV
jgi:uncharacterized membrane protein YheB (UPF0754 family)